ncbi:hypothetical protein [Methylobacterium flocculans]|uniref:hypothetical protein n=1 Tax=Methylobacterium flocculans TaxID=2984843 RepID=UPI0021F263E7|nr:hypothetical protein [Methylobacterium sp. FF17]
MTPHHAAFLIVVALLLFCRLNTLMRIAMAAGLVGIAKDGTLLGSVASMLSLLFAVALVAQATWRLIPRRKARSLRGAR